MAKPTTTPRWASSGADLREPISGRKDKGFFPKQRPAPQILNWLFYWIYQWVTWFGSKAHTDHAVTGFNETGADWARAGLYSMQASVDSKLFLVAIKGIAVGEKISSATFRVKPGGATNTVACGLAVYKDDAIVAAAGIGSSTAGAAWEDVSANSGTWTDVGGVPTLVDYVLGENEQLYATVNTSGGGAGARRFGAVTVYPA